MTYFFVLCHSERSEESHNLSEEYILRTFLVGYFAIAQYDVLFASPKEKAKLVLLSLRGSIATAAIPREGVGLQSTLPLYLIPFYQRFGYLNSV